ncbi:hypothetical protein AB4Y85_15330 [Microvirga sp. 2YAF29]|uniref:hypothetical protein n=1 Tax=Microvirga sp. 2YAF29 TaxID=3233031 RepID=UPI003F9BE5B9
MSKINEAMLDRMAAIFELTHELPPKLVKILNSGFVEREDHCFLKAFQKRAPKSDVKSATKHLYDSTGIECWVNDIRIDSEENEDHLQVAFIFAAKLIRKWKRSKFHRPALLLLATDETSTQLKFHLKRHEESWFAEDLEGYGSTGISVFEV